ncbi:MAG: MarR family winged helix-turn-helix transcriptional regulator [Coriobacteriales bacterium]
MFMRDLSVIERRMRLYAEHALADLGVGFPGQVVLMQLGARGSCRQEDLASHFSIDKGSIAKTVGKLEAKGLVSRVLNPADKREKLVELTAQGREVLDAMGSTYVELEQLMFAGLSQQELETTFAALERIAANLTEEKED